MFMYTYNLMRPMEMFLSDFFDHLFCFNFTLRALLYYSLCPPAPASAPHEHNDTHHTERVSPQRTAHRKNQIKKSKSERTALRGPRDGGRETGLDEQGCRCV